jgi:hypothetical protein
VVLLGQRGGVHAPACAPADGLVYRGIHDQSIRVRRGSRPIPCGPGGSVDEYVSFYFCIRSPMLYRIQHDAALRPVGGPDDLVYLVSSVERVLELGLRFVFSDGHGLQELTNWYDDVAALGGLDWDAIDQSYWRSESDPDLARRKQAEFLVHRFLPLGGLLGIACRSEAVVGLVRSRLGAPHASLSVTAKPDWYYREP